MCFLLVFVVIKSVPPVVRSWYPRGHCAQTLILMLWLVSNHTSLLELRYCNAMQSSSFFFLIYLSYFRQDLSQPWWVWSSPGKSVGSHQQTQQPTGPVPQHRGGAEDTGYDQVISVLTACTVHPNALRVRPLSLVEFAFCFSDCSVVKDTRWRMAAEQKIMEIPPIVAMLLSTVTRYVVILSMLSQTLFFFLVTKRWRGSQDPELWITSKGGVQPQKYCRESVYRKQPDFPGPIPKICDVYGKGIHILHALAMNWTSFVSPVNVHYIYSGFCQHREL